MKMKFLWNPYAYLRSTTAFWSSGSLWKCITPSKATSDKLVQWSFLNLGSYPLLNKISYIKVACPWPFKPFSPTQAPRADPFLSGNSSWRSPSVHVDIHVGTRLKSWSFLGQHGCLQFNLLSHVHIHNIIQIHDNALWDWQYFTKCFQRFLTFKLNVGNIHSRWH